LTPPKGSRDGLNRELSYPWVVEEADSSLRVAFACRRRAIKYLRLDPMREPSGIDAA
jgi:predicted neuraminidase